MSWQELDAWLTGYADRIDMAWQMNAQLAVWITAPHLRKSVKASELYIPRAERAKRKAERPRIPDADELTKIVHERLKWLQ